MSVETDSDMRRDRAKSLLEQAHIELLAATHPNTWGSSDYKEEYIDALHEVTRDLAKIIRKI